MFSGIHTLVLIIEQQVFVVPETLSSLVLNFRLTFTYPAFVYVCVLGEQGLEVTVGAGSLLYHVSPSNWIQSSGFHIRWPSHQSTLVLDGSLVLLDLRLAVFEAKVGIEYRKEGKLVPVLKDTSKYAANAK